MTQGGLGTILYLEFAISAVHVLAKASVPPQRPHRMTQNYPV